MRYYFFHLMPWPNLPDGVVAKTKTAWVQLPNHYFDPETAVGLYARYLDELVRCEKLGFDGVCINEHHQTAYGLMPSPNLIAASIAARTQRIRIAVIGNALPFYDPPQRVAEEYAMLDLMSRGRLIAGFVVGTGAEYYNYGLDPTTARERFYEAHDLILDCWTKPGPFEFYGKHYRYKYVNPWQKPLQAPHPPIWVPGAWSTETMDWVAARGYAYMGIPYFHLDVFRRTFGYFREAVEKTGRSHDPEKLGWLVPIYVSETDARAREEYEKHLFYFIENLLPGLVQYFPPGYTSAKSALRILQAKGQFMGEVKSWNEIEAGGYAVVGSPATVADRLAQILPELGCGNLLGLFQLGSLPANLTEKSTHLFMHEVRPVLDKKLAGRARS